MGGRGRRKQGIGSAANNGGEPARQDLTIPDHARLASTPGCTPSSHDPSNVSGLDQKPARPQSPRPLFRVTLSFQPLPPGFVAPSRPAPTPRLLPLFPEREVEPLGQRSPTLGPPPSIPGTSQFLASRDGNVEKGSPSSASSSIKGFNIYQQGKPDDPDSDEDNSSFRSPVH